MSWFPTIFGMPIAGLARFHNRHPGQVAHPLRDALAASAGGDQFSAGDTIRDGKRSASEQVGRQDYAGGETADGHQSGSGGGSEEKIDGVSPPGRSFRKRVNGGVRHKMVFRQAKKGHFCKEW